MPDYGKDKIVGKEKDKKVFSTRVLGPVTEKVGGKPKLTVYNPSLGEYMPALIKRDSGGELSRKRLVD